MISDLRSRISDLRSRIAPLFLPLDNPALHNRRARADEGRRGLGVGRDPVTVAREDDLVEVREAVVRELEGALKRVIAHAHFMGRDITIELIRESLKDLLALQDKLVSVDNIQRTVAEYYKIKISDLLSKRRSRSVARPRQVAMALSKELTNHSLPEIGDAFGGRDHTTVLHACRKIAELRESDADICEDYKNLLRTLTT